MFVGTFFLGFYLGTINGEMRENTLSQTNGNQNQSPVVQFARHIIRNQVFEKDLGNNLVFRLTPNSNGWDADIVSKNAKQDDYGFASIATPPFHGINALQIEGWHFRNTDNTAPNDGSINAPREKRNFSFVLNKVDADTMANIIQEFSSGKTDDFSPKVPIGQGELLIENLKLGNLNTNAQAWIEEMDITVNIIFPDTK